MEHRVADADHVVPRRGFGAGRPAGPAVTGEPLPVGFRAGVIHLVLNVGAIWSVGSGLERDFHELILGDGLG